MRLEGAGIFGQGGEERNAGTDGSKRPEKMEALPTEKTIKRQGNKKARSSGR